jgi:hypothetical protein
VTAPPYPDLRAPFLERASRLREILRRKAALRLECGGGLLEMDPCPVAWECGAVII